MRKVLVFLIVGFVFLGCSAQNADAQSANDAQRIVGTWIRNGTDRNRTVYTYTFNANGTCAYYYRDAIGNHNTLNGKYWVSGSKIIYTFNSDEAGVYDIYFSTDGRILVFNGRWYERQ